MIGRSWFPRSGGWEILSKAKSAAKRCAGANALEQFAGKQVRFVGRDEDHAARITSA
jgi:hypothetical protein